MPLQNRVDPWGDLQAVDARGVWMGNRGRLHDESKRITRQFEIKRWISCALFFKGYKRELMSPDSYTELFFMDEATAYAAGHRPCAECRREAYKRFKATWATCFPEQPNPSAETIDRMLHASRLNADGNKRIWRALVNDLPDGALIEVDGQCLLLWQGRQWQWSFTGYQPAAQLLPAESEVTVLTPEPIVKLFAAGLSETLQVAVSHSDVA
ncbi:hypothetical protein JQR88_00670 [Pseudomonas luteola]|uniref:hypothetical protein n=1 Tax=Pseudomonas luteola TaxID=47886 RepID=UPI003DA075E6